MKTTKWYKEGQPIPDGGVYLESKQFVVGYDEAIHSQMNDTPVYETFFLYEVPYEA